MNLKLSMIAVIALSLSILPAFALSQPITVDTSQGVDSPQERAKIFDKIQLPKSSNTNYLFSIIITPTGLAETNVIVSSDNLTAIKNNVAFFTACGEFLNGLCQPPIATTAQPNTNYCPLSKFILINQGYYINKLFNSTTGLDLTDLVYPSYCYVETGKNPVNGQGQDPTPTPQPTSFLTMVTDKKSYNFGDKINISGTSPNQVPDIGITVRAPNGNLVSIDQTTAIAGKFTDSFQTGGVLWSQTGNYTIKAVQGTNTAIQIFTLTSAVPEFPQTLGIILAITVLSGIILTAKREIRK